MQKSSRITEGELGASYTWTKEQTTRRSAVTQADITLGSCECGVVMDDTRQRKIKQRPG